MNLKENIKKELRLLTEQTQIPNSKSISFATCGGRTRGGIGSITVNGQSPQVGDIIKADFCNTGAGTNIRTIFVRAVNGPGNVTTQPNLGVNGHVYGTGNSNIFDPTSGAFCGNCVQPASCTNCSHTPNPPTSYPYAAWSNLIPGGSCHDVSPAGATTCIGPPSCDTTPASPCATQWWQNPNATWAANWINNHDCTNYNWPALNLEQQALDIMNDTNNYGTNTFNPQTGPFNGWSDIWGAATASGLINPHKGQFIGKMAKSKFSQCQKVACNC